MSDKVNHEAEICFDFHLHTPYALLEFMIRFKHFKVCYWLEGYLELTDRTLQTTLHFHYKVKVALFLFNKNISALQHYVLSLTHGLTLHSTVVTIRTNRFNIRQFYVLPTQCIYVI